MTVTTRRYVAFVPDARSARQTLAEFNGLLASAAALEVLP